jgi:hypothetical protein
MLYIPFPFRKKQLPVNNLDDSIDIAKETGMISRCSYKQGPERLSHKLHHAS